MTGQYLLPVDKPCIASMLAKFYIQFLISSIYVPTSNSFLDQEIQDDKGADLFHDSSAQHHYGDEVDQGDHDCEDSLKIYFFCKYAYYKE